MKSEEIVNIFFDEPPQVNVKYSLGENDIVQTRRTKDIVFYPHYGVPFLDMLPPVLFINNNNYGVLDSQNVPHSLISLASRKGGYHFIDYPLYSYVKTFQIHKDIEYDMEIDYSRSFIRFTKPVPQPVPFVLQFVFKLHEEN